MLKWLTLAKRTLQLREVKEALQLDFSSGTGGSFSDNLLISESQLELFCGSLVTVRNQSIRLIHASTTKYPQQSPPEHQLHEGFHEFFVDAAAENARIVGLSIFYISTHCDAHSHDSGRLSGENLKTMSPLIEYSCFYRMAHLTESDPQALLRHKSQLDRFFRSRRPLRWIEFCMKLDPNCWSLLCFTLQTMLDWLSDSVGVIETETMPDTLLLLRCWSELYLQLVTEFRRLLEKSCQAIHRIDLRPMIRSDLDGALAQVSRSGFCEEHVVLSEVNMFVTSSTIPTKRRLPRNTGSGEALLFFIDMRRETLITLDVYPHRGSRLYCQEMATGRRLQPVIDMELPDDGTECQAQRLILSPDARYLAVLYLIYNTGERYKTYYTAVWRIQDEIDFTRKEPYCPWARKCTALATKCHESVDCLSVAFQGNTILCCPNGRIELSTGQELVHPSMCHTNLRSATTAFSADGNVMLFHEDRADKLRIIQSTGEDEVIALGSRCCQIYSVSSTGRYIICSLQPTWDLVLYDRILCATSPLNCQVGRFASKDNIFTSDDKLLFIRCRNYFAYEDMVMVGSLDGFTFRLLATKHMNCTLLAWQLDVSNDMLHLVMPNQIWSRLLFDGSQLCQIDHLEPLRQYSVVKQCVSPNSRQLAVVHIGNRKYVNITNSFKTSMLTFKGRDTNCGFTPAWKEDLSDYKPIA
jgi:hypothetical protein